MKFKKPNLLLIVLLISLILSLLLTLPISQFVNIYQLTPASDASLSLSSPTLNLINQEKLTLDITYSSSQPAHFIQALIQFDPNIIQPILPVTKTHSLPLHAEKLLDNQTLRISASGINPDQPGKTLGQTSGQHDLATVEFKVLTSEPTLTTLKLITNPNNLSDWQSSVIAHVDKQQNPVNMLDQTNNLTLAINYDQTDVYQTLTPVTSQAALITETTTASASLETTSSAALQSPLPTPSPTPIPTELSIWQKLLNYFKSLFEQIDI